MTDGRVAPWFRVNSDFSTTSLGQKLRARFGNEGLAVWVAVLAAAKRYPVEGVISYASDADLWPHLGVEPPAFTAAEFFTVTGRHHETRKQKRDGRVWVTLTNWDELQRRRPRNDGSTTAHDAMTTQGRPINDASTTSKPPGQGRKCALR